jgi:xanthosine utilization system XapX-like protein
MDKDLVQIISMCIGVLAGIALILMGLLIPCPTDVVLYSLVGTGTLIIASLFGVTAVGYRNRANEVRKLNGEY